MALHAEAVSANILHGKAVRFSEYDRMAAQFFQKYLDKIYQD